MSNKQAGELYGWRVSIVPGVGECYIPEERNKLCRKYVHTHNGWRKVVYGIPVSYFDPMTRWDHAGMLVEKLFDPNVRITLSNTSDKKVCSIEYPFVCETGKTAPEAITRAFIKAMEAK